MDLALLLLVRPAILQMEILARPTLKIVLLQSRTRRRQLKVGTQPR